MTGIARVFVCLSKQARECVLGCLCESVGIWEKGICAFTLLFIPSPCSADGLRATDQKFSFYLVGGGMTCLSLCFLSFFTPIYSVNPSNFRNVLFSLTNCIVLSLVNALSFLALGCSFAQKNVHWAVQVFGSFVSVFRHVCEKSRPSTAFCLTIKPSLMPKKTFFQQTVADSNTMKSSQTNC